MAVLPHRYDAHKIPPINSRPSLHLGSGYAETCKAHGRNISFIFRKSHVSWKCQVGALFNKSQSKLLWIWTIA